MKRLNITMDNELYEKARTIAFLRRLSISEIIRTSLHDWMKRNISRKDKILMSEEYEDRLLAILEKDEFIPAAKARKKLGL
jgi:hypothetical protein